MESKVGEGSRFSFLIPLALSLPQEVSDSSTGSRSNSSLDSFRANPTNEIDSLVEALTSCHVPSHSSQRSSPSPSNDSQRHRSRTSSVGSFRVSGSQYPVRAIKIPECETEPVLQSQNSGSCSNPPTPVSPSKGILVDESLKKPEKPSLRVLIVEVSFSWLYTTPSLCFRLCRITISIVFC